VKIGKDSWMATGAMTWQRLRPTFFALWETNAEVKRMEAAVGSFMWRAGCAIVCS
jgi:hypothetical protein